MRNKILVIVFILIASGAFYWFEWRPASIRSHCMEGAVPFNIQNQRDLAPYRDIFELGDALYKNCVRLYGISE